VVEPIPRRRRRTRREPDAEPRPAAPGEFAATTAGPPPDLDDDLAGERGLRGLIGGGSSQVSVGAALRARDATRPTPQELEAAEANLVIIRRGWTPPPER
jgi:hypothetical protein